MSLVDDVLSSAAPSLLSALGDAAEYRPGGTGEPIALRAIDSPEAQSVGQSGFVELRHEISIERTAVTAPARGDSLTFTARGETFLVQHSEPDGPFWRLIVRQGGA
ncbi:hypothetical protein MARPU_09540 [Marichromatium purpuratum 984]|uniref:Uncharacterized protein n=1 Tax=Marichromatium purpuratum 984 TaxID=765910 RepID=W0E7K6_MARPU|nr:hypothetical protein [Marichromatium purpuratum]AHF05508.1 hypothetical protein MARPU_09540 [Marichromatium purpuratum 984]